MKQLNVERLEQLEQVEASLYAAIEGFRGALNTRTQHVLKLGSSLEAIGEIERLARSFRLLDLLISEHQVAKAETETLRKSSAVPPEQRS